MSAARPQFAFTLKARWLACIIGRAKCSDCRGTGTFIPFDDAFFAACGRCDGTGKIAMDKRVEIRNQGTATWPK